jgi:hypothetical protein
VDLVVNHWLTGEQQAVARVFLSGGRLKTDSPDPVRWEPVVEDAIARLDLEGHPEDALDELQRAISGSHLFATGPHEQKECPFRGWSPVRIESTPAQRHAAHL